MKKQRQLITRWAILCICIISFNSYSAQNLKNSYLLGTNKQFIQELEHEIASVKNGKSSPSLKLKISDSGFLNAKINYQKAESSKEIHLQGEILGKEKGSFTINVINDKIEGNIILMNDKKAYSYYSDAGNNYIKEAEIDKLICFGMPTMPEELKNKKTKNTGKALTTADVSNLQSYPGSTVCILLDFDGYNMPAGHFWNGGNPINAEPSTMTPEQIMEAWEIVCEDYRLFFLNVTTNEAVYNSYPKNRRQRCVITPTSYFYTVGGTGVAQVGSYLSGNDIPCWAFPSGAGNSGKIIGEICSHEVGHTMGLYHDGQTGVTPYYAGPYDWAPIMGLGYYKNITQWSKGEYTGASNKQDDIFVMASSAGLLFRGDDAGNTLANAAPLFYNGNQFFSKERVLEKSNDVDVYTFNSTGGSVYLTVKTVARHANLRFKVTLQGGSLAPVVAVAYPWDLSTPVMINRNIAPGKYYVTVEPVDFVYTNPDIGYTSYGCVGSYTVTGTLSSTPLQKTALSTNEVKANEQIKIYPNPVKDELTIDTGSKEKYEVQIFNAAGQFIYKKNIQEAKNKIPFANKPIGKYMVTVRNIDTSTAKTFPVIKK